MFTRRISGRPLVLALAIATLAPLLSGHALETTAQANPTVTNSYTCPDSYIDMESEAKPGVTVCHGIGYHDDYYLIAVDLTEGAKLHVTSKRVEGGPGADALFRTRDVGDWYTYISDYQAHYIPSPDALAAVVNAGFLVTDDGDSTPLSLPEMYMGQIATTGYAGTHTQDPAWGVAPKFSLRLGPASAPGAQEVHNGILGDVVTGEYDTFDVYTHFAGYYGGTVGFPSWTNPSDPNEDKNRTFAFRLTWHPETGHDMFFILMNLGGIDGGVTLAEMDAEIQGHILDGWWPDWTIQFDGGRSTHFCTSTVCYYGAVTRDVPEVLAIYGAES